MLKKIIAYILVLSCVFSCITVARADTGINDSDIKLKIDGNYMDFDLPLIMSGDRVMVPMRAVFEYLGATIGWIDEIQKVTADINEKHVDFRIGDTLADVDGEVVDMYSAAIIYNGCTYVSARFTAEMFGMYVSFDDGKKTLFISKEQRIEDKGRFCEIISVTANGDDGNRPVNVIDENYYTRWSSDLSNAEITLELADISTVSYIGIACYNGTERQTDIGISVSEDGINYTRVIDHVLTSNTLAMEPIPLGGDYRAKFVRIHSFGNTKNEWNSITELKVYSPQDDGSMPVDQNGPNSDEREFESDIPEDLKDTLMSIEELYAGVVPWLANLYDPETGGFNMAMSGRDDPNMEPAIEMTSWGLDVLYKYTDCNFSDMPDDIKQKFIDFFNDRQDPETGFYIDKQGEVNWREAARTNSAVRYAFQKLKAEPRYPLPSENNDADSETGSTAKVIPDYFATVDTYIDWIESLDWDNASWGAGDIVGTHTLYFGYLDEENAKIYEDAMFEWLEKRQDPETGLWGKGINFNSISGAFKVAVIYANGKRTMPNAEKVIESVFKCYSMDRAVNPYFIRNPISLLLMIIQQNENLKGQIRQGVIDNIDTILLSFKDFLCPDGGFSAGKGKSMVAFGGVTGSHGLYEGDIDATLMMLIVRNELYSILGGKAPKLPADRFWAWITGEEALPSPYKDSSLAESSGDSVTINFDNFDAGYILAGDEFGGILIDPILTAKIEADRNRKDNNVLCLSYNGDTTSASGPSITLSDPAANIKYVPPSISVAEFDIMVEDMKTSANAYINFGSAPAYALSMNGSGVVNVTSRVAPDKIAYGGTMFKLSPKEWYHIRLEYDPISENDNATITYYVDGELLGQNSNYNGCHLGASPAEMNKCMQICWYKAGKGKIYIDNVKLSSQHT